MGLMKAPLLLTMKKRNRLNTVRMNFLNAARPHAVRRFALIVLLTGLFAGAGFTGQAFAQVSRRAVQGRVVTADDSPVRNAIVYLSDTRTMTVSSYITQEDGAYRFDQLSSNDDYKLWAQLDGKKSKTKVLSSFDDRQVFHVILKIDSAK